MFTSDGENDGDVNGDKLRLSACRFFIFSVDSVLPSKRDKEDVYIKPELNHVKKSRCKWRGG